MLAIIPGLNIGPMEMMFFGVIALLLFGKRLPEVARSLGKGIVEFKKGVRGVEDEFKSTVSTRNDAPRRRPDPVDEEQQEWSAPKFEPPKSEPVAASDKQEA
jgi:sec-independent protein translocase protein TatA